MKINFPHIRTQLILSFCLVVLIPASIMGIYAMQTTTDALRKQELNIQASIVEKLSCHLETLLVQKQNDLIFLSQSQPLNHYLNLRSHSPNSPTLEKARQAVEQEFLAFSYRSQSMYYQIRYLDKTGQEIARVDTDGLNSQVIAPAQLQNKAHRDYFQETMQLLDKEILVSPLELNQENGKIEVPHKPVIRYATPVYYPDRQPAGIVITNVDARQFLSSLGNTWLVDQNGYYLVHPEAYKRWGSPRDLNSGYSLAQDYPNLMQTISELTKGFISTEKSMFTFLRVSISESGFWFLITPHSNDEMLHNINTFRIIFGIILVAVLLIALLIALFMSKRITNPIEHLTHIVKQVAAGNGQIRAKVEQLNELSTLGKELNAMLEAINASKKALQKSTQEAKAASLSKIRFLAGMSHELRTPLNAIIGYGEMLQEEIDSLGKADLSSDIEKIYLAGKNLLNTINDILDLSKIEAGKMELYTETFYLPNMVDNIVQTLQPLLTKNQETLEVHYAEGLREMHTDLTKLRQVLLKLLSNASKFNKHRKIISLEVLSENNEDEKEWIIFRIQDHGVGMDDEQKQQLLHQFSQQDQSNIEQYGGLGLVITHHFVEMMGGKIHIESELGKGSTFTIHLPAFITPSVQPPSSRASTDTEVLEEGSMVLVIDDDPQVRYVLENYLDKLGYQVEVADCGEEGLRLAKKLLPDIITSDVMMPKMDGWEVLSHLKADPELASIPVIMLSMMEEKNVGYSLGASDYLTKPITREEVLKVLQKYHFSYNESARLIMIIDDDVVNRDLVARMLRKEGFRVCKVEDGRVALNAIQKKRPDLVLLDLQMPEMDGFEFSARLHQFDDSIPIVILSAKDITVEDRLRLEHVAGIFQKGSYSRDELVALVNKLLSA